MTVSSAAEVDGAFGKMRTMLGADGYELVTEAVDDRVSLTVVATADACVECLVPREIFTSIVVDALKTAGITVPADKIEVTYPVTDV